MNCECMLPLAQRIEPAKALPKQLPRLDKQEQILPKTPTAHHCNPRQTCNKEVVCFYHSWWLYYNKEPKKRIHKETTDQVSVEGLGTCKKRHLEQRGAMHFNEKILGKQLIGGKSHNSKVNPTVAQGGPPMKPL